MALWLFPVSVSDRVYEMSRTILNLLAKEHSRKKIPVDPARLDYNDMMIVELSEPVGRNAVFIYSKCKNTYYNPD